MGGGGGSLQADKQKHFLFKLSFYRILKENKSKYLICIIIPAILAKVAYPFYETILQ